jgi:hypothetical protein
LLDELPPLLPADAPPELLLDAPPALLPPELLVELPPELLLELPPKELPERDWLALVEPAVEPPPLPSSEPDEHAMKKQAVAQTVKERDCEGFIVEGYVRSGARTQPE